MNLYFIDLFCGAGGTTTGVERAELFGQKIAKVIACINHDALAIASHHANWPDALHMTEDIRHAHLEPIVAMVNKIRIAEPDARIIIWASLECTNFSKAKGGLPRNADSRTLADELDRYVLAIEPDALWIENVTEFLSWGPLDEKGKPINRKNGIDYQRWRNRIEGYGYRSDHKIINAADLGAFTSRERLFIQFALSDMPICWPEPTHAKNPEKAAKLFGKAFEKWKAVKHVLDFSNEGESIFTRLKPLCDKTLERIYAGLVKYVANGDTHFIKKYYSGRPEGKVTSIDSPAGTITTTDSMALVTPFLLKYNSYKNGKYCPPSINDPLAVIPTRNTHYICNACMVQRNSGSPSSKIASIENPSRTITGTGGNLNLVQPFILKYNSTSKKGKHIPPSVDDPSPTVTAQARLGIVNPCFLQSYYGNGGVSGPNEPCNTISTKDRFALVQPISQGKRNDSVENPLGSITTIPKARLVEATPWVMNTNFNNVGTSIDEPTGTITANRKQHYLMNPQYFNNGGSIENPCFTLIARMDKAPPYLITTDAGELAVQVFEGDSEPMIKIKQFMAAYGIVDIKMRMLMISELLRIQGFGDGYILKGSKADQKKFIGNSVEYHVPKGMCEAVVMKLMERKQQAAA